MSLAVKVVDTSFFSSAIRSMHISLTSSAVAVVLLYHTPTQLCPAKSKIIILSTHNEMDRFSVQLLIARYNL